MRTFLLGTVCAVIVSAGASAHIYINEKTAPAGYKQDITLRVPHGCGASPVKEVHVQIPPNVTGVMPEMNRDWKIEIKNRKLDKPMQGEGGVTLTETVDEIIWKEPASTIPASGYFDSFHFRVSLPKEEGQVLFFKSYAVCVQGDDKYVDIPKEPLHASMPDFAKKFGAFMRSVKGPAPYVVLIKPDRPQYPWEAMEVTAAEAAQAAKAAAK